MNQVQQWPLSPSSARFRILLGASVVAAILICYLFWIGPGKNSLAQTTSISSKAWPGELPVRIPAAAPAISESREDSGNREAEFLSYMGDQMFQRGDLVGASEAYKKALEQSPNSEWIHLKMALCLSRLSRPDEAMESLREAIHIAPDFTQAHHQMGLLLMKKGDFVEATEHFMEVTRRKPDQAGAFNSLGLALARQGRLNQASNNFAHAVQLDGRYVEARFNLAQIFLQQGARAQAAAELDRALEINPQFKAARALREQLSDVIPANLQARR